MQLYCISSNYIHKVKKIYQYGHPIAFFGLLLCCLFKDIWHSFSYYELPVNICRCFFRFLVSNELISTHHLFIVQTEPQNNTDTCFITCVHYKHLMNATKNFNDRIKCLWIIPVYIDIVEALVCLIYTYMPIYGHDVNLVLVFTMI